MEKAEAYFGVYQRDRLYTLISSSSFNRTVSCGLPRNHLSDSKAFCSPFGRTKSECGESGIHTNMLKQRIGIANDTITNVRYVVYGPTAYSTKNPATKKNCISVPSDDLKRN